ncbi:MAG: hypothetical protein AAF500_18110 [Myxococcota bacterium]
MKWISWVLVPFCALLVMGADVCEPTTSTQAIYTRGSATRKIETPKTRDNRGFAFSLKPGEEVDRIKLGPHKILCLYSEPPNAPKLFEHEPTHKHIVGLDDVPVTTEPFQLVACTNGTTFPSVIEDLGPRIGAASGNAFRPFPARYGRVEDIGECSGWIQTDFILAGLKNGYDAQLEGRYGPQRSPQGTDFVGPYDFVTGLHPPSPDVGPWVFYDYNPTNLGDGWIDAQGLPWGGPYPPNTHYGALGEIALRFRVRMNGDVDWRPDPDWIGDGSSPGLSRFVSGSLNAALGITFWPIFFFGDCDKKRHMLVTMRGPLEAASDGGLGIRFYPEPYSWAGLQEWTARRICNKEIKPIIQSQMVDNAIAATQTPTGEVISQTSSEDGTSSRLPFFRNDLQTPIPAKRFVVTERFIHAVFCETQSDCPSDLYQELKARGSCGLGRDLYDPDEPYIVVSEGGF